MNEEPLHLIPESLSARMSAESSTKAREPAITRSKSTANSARSAAYVYSERLKQYDGDWTKVVQDVRVQAR